MKKTPHAGLLREAAQAAARAYAPYSKFRVGAAVLADKGRIFRGCNVENASYGLTVCAERAAVFAAVAAGCRRIAAIAVVVKNARPAYPCGACLQVLGEFAGPGTPVLLASAGKLSKPVRCVLGDLLPKGFKLSHTDRMRARPRTSR